MRLLLDTFACFGFLPHLFTSPLLATGSIRDQREMCCDPFGMECGYETSSPGINEVMKLLCQRERKLFAHPAKPVKKGTGTFE
jgi:hypothetical protein